MKFLVGVLIGMCLGAGAKILWDHTQYDYVEDDDGPPWPDE